MTQEQFDRIKQWMRSRIDSHDEWRELRDAFVQLYESSQWQPIETAPKDGEPLEVIIEAWGKRQATIAHWVADVYEIEWDSGEPDSEESGWFEAPIEIERCARIEPTHWRCLPEVPK